MKNTNTGEENTGDKNSGDGNSGYGNSGDGNSGNWNSGDGNSGDGNSGNWNSGDGNSGDGNSGDGNSGDGNSGWFNTDEPKARFFNKETGIKLSDFYNSDDCPNWSDFPLNRWVDKKDMTDKEKKEVEVSDWETMGGYFKTLDYKEAWKVFWEEMSQENRDKFLNLPNFDPKIFKEITGIDVDNKVKVDKKVKIKLSNDQIVEGEIVE